VNVTKKGVSIKFSAHLYQYANLCSRFYFVDCFMFILYY